MDTYEGRSEFIPRGRAAQSQDSLPLAAARCRALSEMASFIFFLMRRGRPGRWVVGSNGAEKIVQETETLHNLMRGCTSFSAAFGT